MSDEFTKAPRAKVEAEESHQRQDEQREASGTPGAQQDAAPTSEPHESTAGTQGTQNTVNRASAWVSKTFPGHENAFLGGVCGLIVAIVMAAIGFWRTLLLVLLVLIGVAIGQQADGDPKILRVLGKLFRDHEGR